MRVAQSCPTLCDHMDYTVHGILQARMLEWVAFPFSEGIFPTPGSNPGLPHCRQILCQLTHQGSPGKKRKTNKVYTLVNGNVPTLLSSPNSNCSPHNRSKAKKQAVGARNSDFIQKASRWRDGGLVSQRTILPELEFRLLLHLKGRGCGRLTPASWCQNPSLLQLST